MTLFGTHFFQRPVPLECLVFHKCEDILVVLASNLFLHLGLKNFFPAAAAAKIGVEKDNNHQILVRKVTHFL